MNPTPERRLYLAAINVGRIEIALENAKIELSEATRLFVPETARPISEWHEDKGTKLWWKFPVVEPPYCGSPGDDDFPDHVTHWTDVVVPTAPAESTACADCERQNCDADSTGKCPISGEEVDDGYNTVAPGDHLL
jgi:hypothetical protein